LRSKVKALEKKSNFVRCCHEVGKLQIRGVSLPEQGSISPESPDYCFPTNHGLVVLD
jgi:hypothetical protein